MSEFLGPVSLGKISVQYVRVHFPTANVEIPVPHGLGIVAMGAVVVWKDKFCDIKGGSMPPASNVLFMVSDTDLVTATIRVEAINLSQR